MNPSRTIVTDQQASYKGYTVYTLFVTLPSFLSCQSHSQTQFDLSIPSSTKDLLSRFSIIQTQLLKPVVRLQENIDYQDTHQKLTRAIKAKNSSIHTFANKLKKLNVFWIFLLIITPIIVDPKDLNLLKMNLLRILMMMIRLQMVLILQL